jgi:hypothetical protein
MAKKSVSLTVLAEQFRLVDINDPYAWKAINEAVTRLDEAFFRSSKIEKRGDFKVMCGLERN